jgi:hypothetical protein
MSFGFSVLDFVSLIQYANKLRREFLDAPGQFKAVSEELVDPLPLPPFWAVPDSGQALVG